MNKECVNCFCEFNYKGIDDDMNLCLPCFKQKEKNKNNPTDRRLNYELKRNFLLNDLLQESLKALEKDSVNDDLVKRIKLEIIKC